ncbi:hypothetical protein [Sphingobacterium sp.]|uniref:leucine-rich repeat domain-containing protein n=1 Tax=Sphingobacterium sp. TaxID=341027 RepID=UPI0031E1F3FD
MKTYSIIFSFILLTLTAAAQRKKKEKFPEPKHVEFVPVVEAKPVNEGAESPAVFAAPMPTTSPVPILATTIDGKEMRFKNIEELTDTDLSKLKELSFKSIVPAMRIESSMLKKIIDTATQLEILGIEDFELDAFPDIKTPNHHLKTLSLEGNRLQSLPESIFKLTALENFNCSNPLTELPQSFAQLKNLKQLALDKHMFTAFPKEIFSLNRLSMLYLSGKIDNQPGLKELPDLFQQLPELVELSVQNGALSSLPKSMATLRKLEHANFSHNQFTSFPYVLASNPNLNYVPFDNNPLQWEPFLASIKKIKWQGLFFLYNTGFTKKQYQQIQDLLTNTDVYYDGMND